MSNKQIADQLIEFAARSDVPEDIRTQMKANAEKLKPTEYDLFIYRLVTIVLGLIALITVLGGILIALMIPAEQNVTLPDAIVALGSAAVGALAGLLAPNPKG